MSFKLLYTNLAGPQGDFLVDPAITFEAGQLGTITGNSAGLPVVELALSGNAVLGIIDDNKATQFLATVVAETVVTGQTILNNANVVQRTFAVAAGASVTLDSATNGTIVVATGGTVSYSYYIPGKAGDDTTLASGKCTLWLQPGEYATDVYEVTTASGSTPYAYTVSTALTTSSNSKIMEKGAAGTLLGYVTKTPSAGNPFLHFYKV
jgi:hypothetical protein